MKKIDKGIYSIEHKELAVVTANSKFVIKTPSKDVDDESTDDICSWGEDNLYPQNFLKQFKKTDAAISGFDVLQTAHFGNKFKIYKEIETETGTELIQKSLSSYPEIRTFFRKVKWDKFIAGIIRDFELWWLSFPEFLVSPNKNEIISVVRRPVPWCRFEKPLSRKFFRNIILNTDWESRKKELDLKIPLIPELLSAEEVKEYVKSKNIQNFIIPVTNILDDEKIYPKVGWHSSFVNGWVDTVLSVPEFKKYMFENQLHFKYVVYISDELLARKYGNEEWKNFTTEEKEKKRDEIVDLIDEHMSGNKASARSLISPLFVDSSGNLQKGIEVIPIDDKIKDGNFLPDAAAGNSQILFAMGVDPSIIGAGIPGGKNLSGSGSDKREAYTILGTRQPMKRIHTLEVFNFIRDYNGWDEDIEGNFPNQVLTTLDKETSGRTEVTN